VRLPEGYRLVAFDTIGSTNEEARREAATAPAKTVYWARRQTAGRGRRGRSWTSEEGNLFFSLLLKPDCPLAEAAQLSFVSALAMSDILAARLIGREVSLKWPNDVLVDGAKISGLLLEASSSGPTIDAIILGVGLNLVSHPPDTPYPATDMRSAGLDGVGPEAALEWFLEAFELRYRSWRSAGFSGIRANWLERAHRRGRGIEVRMDSETLSGRFLDLDETGALVVETADGATRTVTAGDVHFPGTD
jgi:BirA family biotin operon repressor/biotin-[acetyl-CoA-carboxylase] ligase